MNHYDKELKTKIMNESIECGNIGVVAKKYKIPPSTIHTWFKKSKKKITLDNNKIFKSLKKEISNMELENKILKELLKKTYLVWKYD